jgi:hypothetical protein
MERGPYQLNRGKKCSRNGCSRPAYSKCLCKRHYQSGYMRKYRARSTSATRRASKKYRDSEKGKKNRRAYYEKNRKKILSQARSSNLKKYGITDDDYRKLNADQKGRCAICKKRPRGKQPRSQKLHIDHCHRTGEVRGLLCHGCNIAVGFMEKDPARTLGVLRYLDGSISS